MANLNELVVAQNLVQYWIEKNVNEKPLLGETLFPAKKQIGIKLEWIKGALDQPVALKLSAFDSKTTRRDRKGVSVLDTKMPFFKESKYIDEEMRQMLLTLTQTQNQQAINAILARIFDDEVELIRAARIAAERMRMEALTTGTISLETNGAKYDYDFGVPADQKVTVTTPWNNVNADILGDIAQYKEDMAAKGVIITRALCNSSVAKCFRTNTALKNAIYVFAGGTVNVTIQRALDYIYTETGVAFYVDDSVYVDDSGNAVKYVPDETVVFMPEGNMGYTNYGTTPEEADLMGTTAANVALVDNAIAVTTHVEHDPVNVETKVSMICLPSFERAGEVLIVDTNSTSI